MTSYWIGVASRDHVLGAVRGGFCQLSHGKEAPLRRLLPGDRLVYYSPREQMKAGDSIQAFTAACEVLAEEPYQVEASSAFRPFRRSVRYFHGRDASISGLLTQLSFTTGRSSWGIAMRRGFFEISLADYRVIGAAMHLAESAYPLDGSGESD